MTMLSLSKGGIDVANIDSTFLGSRFFAPAAVVAAAALVIGISGFIQVEKPKASEGAVTIEPIGSAVLLCPEPGTGGDLGVRVHRLAEHRP